MQELHLPEVKRGEIDRALGELAATREAWVTLDPESKRQLVKRMTRDLHAVSDEWATAAARAKGVLPESTSGAEEWLTFGFLLKALNTIDRSLRDLANGQPPGIPGPVTRVGENQLSVQVFPQTMVDRIFFPGMTSEIWTEPGLSEEAMRSEQAALYRGESRPGRTMLVLGAGNVSILGPCDILDMLFCQGAVVAYKTNPVTDHLTPLLERGFAALIEAGYLRIVSGGAAEGAYLAGHDLVDELHLTGSDATYEAIVFGPGREGRQRKTTGDMVMSKPFSCELGNVSPVIIVPGPWRPGDLAYQAEHLAAMQVVNAGFNCLSTRVIIQHASWEHRNCLLDELRRVLGRTPTRPAYYPGAHAIHQRFVAAHPEAHLIDVAEESHLPWTVIPHVDPTKHEDICFTTEGFCSLVAETGLEADDIPSYLERAVEFANDVLWGSLTSTILVHPKSLRQPGVAEALERAVRDLRYGTVGVNVWGALNYATMAGSWGAFPGHPATDIQSGQGSVHNYTMIPRPQKTVIRGPFRQWPKPVVFPSHRTLHAKGRRVIDLEAAPSLLKLPAILAAAMRG